MNIEEEILLSSYSEHHKMYKEFSRIYPLNHPKRIIILEELNKISEKLTIIKERNGRNK